MCQCVFRRVPLKDIMISHNLITNHSGYIPIGTLTIKKEGKWMSLCCTIGYKWVTVMDGVKFEFNDIISLYKKIDS